MQSCFTSFKAVIFILIMLEENNSSGKVGNSYYWNPACEDRGDLRTRGEKQ